MKYTIFIAPVLCLVFNALNHTSLIIKQCVMSCIGVTWQWLNYYLLIATCSRGAARYESVMALQERLDDLGKIERNHKGCKG